MVIQTYISDYLEAILIISKNKGCVRAVDIARQLNITKPSVSVAVKNMLSEHYIKRSERGIITLTKTGKEIAEKAYAKRGFFSKHLINIGVSPETADNDAYMIRHILSDESYEKLKEILE